jgi:putative transposase
MGRWCIRFIGLERCLDRRCQREPMTVPDGDGPLLLIGTAKISGLPVGRRPRGTLIHSDEGTQYGSDAWRRFCRSNHLQPSTSRKGNCWDNAVAESLFGSLKRERIKKQIHKTRVLAQADVDAYINTFYNQTRRHSYLGRLSPEHFEAAHKPRRRGLH